MTDVYGSVDTIIKIIDIVSKINECDFSFIIREDSHMDSDIIGLIPVVYGKSDPIGIDVVKKNVTLWDKYVLNAGMDEDRRLYVGNGLPSVIGDHEYCYFMKADDTSSKNNFKNLCKLKYNIHEYMYVLSVNDLNDSENVAESLKYLLEKI